MMLLHLRGDALNCRSWSLGDEGTGKSKLQQPLGSYNYKKGTSGREKVGAAESQG